MRSIELNQALYPVSLVKTNDILLGYKSANPAGEHAVIADYNDGKHLINTVSNTYGLIPLESTLEVIQKAAENLGIGYTTKANGYFKKNVDFPTAFEINTKFNVDWEICKGDNVAPQLTLYTSYDGTMKLTFAAGIYRSICKNGMVFGGKKGKFQKITGKHTTNMIDKVDEIMRFMDNLMTSQTLISKYFQQLQETKPVDFLESLEYCFNAADLSFKRSTKEGFNTTDQREMVLDVMEAEANTLGYEKESYYSLYQGVNHLISHQEKAGIKMDAMRTAKSHTGLYNAITDLSGVSLN